MCISDVLEVAYAHAREHQERIIIDLGRRDCTGDRADIASLRGDRSRARCSGVDRTNNLIASGGADAEVIGDSETRQLVVIGATTESQVLWVAECLGRAAR